MNRPVHCSLAGFPGQSYLDAMRAASAAPIVEPGLGTLSLAHTQLCPQNRGVLTFEVIDQLRAEFPNTQFRLHANVRVIKERLISDLVDHDRHSEYWSRLAVKSRYMGAPFYTAHAGRRGQGTREDVYRAARLAEKRFGVPVGIEPHYPTPGDLFLFSTWAEYSSLYHSGCYFALDLSHLQIVAHHAGYWDWELVADMLMSERCIEVHVSDNDGTRDQHRTLSEQKPPPWLVLLDIANPNAAIFSEGRQNHSPLTEYR